MQKQTWGERDITDKGDHANQYNLPTKQIKGNEKRKLPKFRNLFLFKLK